MALQGLKTHTEPGRWTYAVVDRNIERGPE